VVETHALRSEFQRVPVYVDVGVTSVVGRRHSVLWDYVTKATYVPW